MSLFPTEAPASTGKPLTDLRRAIPINAETTPGSGTTMFRLSQGGHYFLTRDLLVPAGFEGIRINASFSSFLVLDLNGFTIRGEEGAAVGVWCNNQRGATLVRNGIITGCRQGLYQAGVPEQIAMNVALLAEDLIITGNVENGIEQSRSSSRIRNCILEDNGKSGIVASRAHIENTRACGNGAHGIDIRYHAVVRNCTASRNGSMGIRCVHPPEAEHLISDCIACDNGSTGIFCEVEASVERCLVRGNGINGISSTRASRLVGNLCRGHAVGAGIRAQTTSVLEDNYCVGNQTGVQLTGARNLMRRNICSDNTMNWDIAEGNTGRMAVSVKSLGSEVEPEGRPLGSSDPRVNYTL